MGKSTFERSTEANCLARKRDLLKSLVFNTGLVLGTIIILAFLFTLFATVFSPISKGIILSLFVLWPIWELVFSLIFAGIMKIGDIIERNIDANFEIKYNEIWGYA